MKITESRTKQLLHWLDSMTADHTLLFEEMTLFRDTAALIRQLQADEQAAWHAGLDAGREAATMTTDTASLQAEIEALRADIEAWKESHSMLTDTCHHFQARAERLAKTMRDARNRMREQVKWVACDCGCERDKPAGAVSVTWLRASALLRDPEEGKRWT